MKTTAVVIHNGSLAYYSVSQERDGNYVADLLKFNGEEGNGPPGQINFVKKGRHCTGDSDNENLMDELYSATESRSKKK
jgi:hypothetical protein